MSSGCGSLLPAGLEVVLQLQQSGCGSEVYVMSLRDQEFSDFVTCWIRTACQRVAGGTVCAPCDLGLRWGAEGGLNPGLPLMFHVTENLLQDSDLQDVIFSLCLSLRFKLYWERFPWQTLESPVPPPSALLSVNPISWSSSIIPPQRYDPHRSSQLLHSNSVGCCRTATERAR